MSRIISEALASLEATNYSATETSHNARMVRQAIELLKSPLATALDLSRVDIHTKQTCPVEEFVYVSDLQTIQPPSGQVGEAVTNDLIDIVESDDLAFIKMLARRSLQALRQPVETVGEVFQDANLKMRIREQISNQFGVVSGEQVDNVFAVVKPIIEALRTQPQAPAVEVLSVGTLSVLREWASVASQNPSMNKTDLKLVLENIALELLKIITAKPTVSVSKFEIASTLQKAQRRLGADGDKLKALDPDAVIDAMTDAVHALLQSKGGRG